MTIRMAPDGLDNTKKPAQATMDASGAHPGTAGEASTKGPSIANNETPSHEMTDDFVALLAKMASGTANEASTKGPAIANNETPNQEMANGQVTAPAGRSTTNPVVVEVPLHKGMSKKLLIEIAGHLHNTLKGERRRKEAASAVGDSIAAMEVMKDQHIAEMKAMKKNHSTEMKVIRQEFAGAEAQHEADMTVIRKHHTAEMDAAEEIHNMVSGLREEVTSIRDLCNVVQRDMAALPRAGEDGRACENAKQKHHKSALGAAEESHNNKVSGLRDISSYLFSSSHPYSPSPRLARPRYPRLPLNLSSCIVSLCRAPALWTMLS